MRKKIFFVLLAIIIPLQNVVTAQQCETTSVLPACLGLLKDFTFVKSLTIDKDLFKAGNTEAEYSYLFSKGTTYLVTVCDNNPINKKMVLNFYDSKDKLITSSYNEAEKKHYLSITFPCTATGIYTLKYSFLNNNVSCGISVIGVLKKSATASTN